MELGLLFEAAGVAGCWSEQLLLLLVSPTGAAATACWPEQLLLQAIVLAGGARLLELLVGQQLCCLLHPPKESEEVDEERWGEK